jgi:hypothetical protein
MSYLPLPTSIAHSLLGHDVPRQTVKRKVPSLVDTCAKFIALHVHQVPNKKEGFAALAALHLDEVVQKHMGRLNQVHYFHQYRTHFRDGKPELLENYDSEGRKHGRCLYWNENGRVDSFLKFHHGLPHGSQKWYDQRGVLIRHLRYKLGKYKGEVFIERRTYSPYNFPFHPSRSPLTSASSSPATTPLSSPFLSTSLKSSPQSILFTSCATESAKQGQHPPTITKPHSLK